MSFPKIRLNGRHVLAYLFLFIWAIFSWAPIYRGYFNKIKSLFLASRLSNVQKHSLFEAENYYSLILYCINNVPKGNALTFVNIVKDKFPAHSFYWLRGEYYIEKAPFYLYPRKVHREYDGSPIATEYVVYFNPQTERFSLFHKQRLIYDSF